MALIVGLTGGIASGKSTVAAGFEQRGATVIDADAVGRNLLQPGSPLLEQVLAHFEPLARQRYGQPLRTPDGNLDRRLLRRLIFDDAAERAVLESLLHPTIRARMQALSAAAVTPYQLHVIPLLVERQLAERYDRVLVVDCPESVQVRRLMQRDHIDEAAARAILAAQASRAARLAMANDVIVNDSDPSALTPQIDALDREYRRLAAQQDGPRR